MRTAHHHTETGIDDLPEHDRRHRQGTQNQIVHVPGLIEIEEREEFAPCINRQAVIAAVCLETDAQEIKHLRQGERDHYEIDAASS